MNNISKNFRTQRTLQLKRMVFNETQSMDEVLQQLISMDKTQLYELFKSIKSAFKGSLQSKVEEYLKNQTDENLIGLIDGINALSMDAQSTIIEAIKSYLNKIEDQNTMATLSKFSENPIRLHNIDYNNDILKKSHFSETDKSKLINDISKKRMERAITTRKGTKNNIFNK